MKNLFVILSFLFFAIIATAQTEGLDIKTIDGKEYYQYKVEKGNTLYSISRKFSVSLNKLVDANPEAEKGLSIGQTLNVPKTSSVTEITPKTEIKKEDETHFYHTAQKGETLYSIAKFYGVRPKTLIEENKSFEHNLPLNSIVKVPKEGIEKGSADEITPIEKLPEHPIANSKDSLIQYKVEKGETFYSITKQYNVSQEQLLKFNPSLSQGLKKGDKIIIPIPRKKEITVEEVEAITENNINITPVDGAINIAVFVPFMIEEFKKERAKCLTKDCPVYRPTLLSLNYYHGVQMALDSLKNLGVNANVYVYDTKKDSSVVRKILYKKEFENMQLIFAPFFEHTIAPVLGYAKTHNTMVVNAVPQKMSVLENMQNVSNTLASTETQLSYLGKYVAKKHVNDNVVVLKNNNARENYYSIFQNAFKAQSVDSAAQTYMERGLSDMVRKLKKDQLNVIVVPSKDVRYVSEFLTKLNAVTNQRAYHAYKFKVYGLGDWLSFNNIDVNYMSRFNTCFTRASYVDYSSEKIQKMSEEFRSTYNYDPNKYVLASYEAVLYHTYLMAASGDQFWANYASTSFNGCHINYDFKRSGINGFENKSVVIVGFENNQLQKID